MDGIAAKNTVFQLRSNWVKTYPSYLCGSRISDDYHNRFLQSILNDKIYI